MGILPSFAAIVDFIETHCLRLKGFSDFRVLRFEFRA